MPITVTAVPSLHVGDLSELVVSSASNGDVGEVALTLQFDANVLQVRAGSAGDWAAAAGSAARFSAEISSAEDRVQIRSQRIGAGPGPGAAGGSIALVQFQAVAPGSTWVLVSDVSVKDRAGRALPFVLAASSLQVTAE